MVSNSHRKGELDSILRGSERTITVRISPNQLHQDWIRLAVENDSHDFVAMGLEDPDEFDNLMEIIRRSGKAVTYVVNDATAISNNFEIPNYVPSTNQGEANA